MSRFIVRIPTDDPDRETGLGQLKEIPGAVVLDETPRMLLIEGRSSAKKLLDAVGSRFGWQVFPERSLVRPDPHPRIRKPAHTS